MTGKDLYHIEKNGELSEERLRSLLFFYRPLIGNDALALYQYLFLAPADPGFTELNRLLQDLNCSVDDFEKECRKLNEYRLLKTLRKDDRYVFLLSEPLSRREFVKDDILVRYFILNAGGETYRSILSSIPVGNSYDGFENISGTISASGLEAWTSEDETYLNENKTDVKRSYDFDTLFDVNYFLKDMSTLLFPQRFRTEENLRQIARMADLYNVSNEKMRQYIAKACSLDGKTFDFDLLYYLCSSGNSGEAAEEGTYGVPCVNFLMKLQNGKKVTEADKAMLRKLAVEYELNASVINVLLEYIMKRYDNTIIPSTVYSFANNLHRHDIKTAEEAIEWLNSSTEKNASGRRKDIIATYDDSSNPEFDEDRYREIMNRRNRK